MDQKRGLIKQQPAFLPILRCAFAVGVSLSLATAGCLPENVGADPAKPRAALLASDSFSLATEIGTDGALWLEISSTHDAPAIGGYVSPEPTPRRSLVVMLPGATTWEEDGVVGHALYFHRGLGPYFENQGFRVWTLARQECGTPYGGEDLAQSLAAIDWLQREGMGVLEVDRVFLLGYSTGGTLAALIGTMRELDGIAVVSAILDPRQIFVLRGGFEFFGAVFPNNENCCQIRDTLRAYGPQSNPAWNRIGIIDRLAEIQSPTLFFHGALDLVHLSFAFVDLRRRHAELVASGANLVPMEFLLLSDGDHFATVLEDSSRASILDYFARLEQGNRAADEVAGATIP